LSVVQPTGVSQESLPKLLLFLSTLVKSDNKFRVAASATRGKPSTIEQQ